MTARQLGIANAGDNDVWVYFGNGDGSAQTPTILNLTGNAPTGIAIADLRGNGKKDIIVSEADSASIEVFLGNGNGTFQPSVRYSLFAAVLSVVVAGSTTTDIPTWRSHSQVRR